MIYVIIENIVIGNDGYYGEVSITCAIEAYNNKKDAEERVQHLNENANDNTTYFIKELPLK